MEKWLKKNLKWITLALVFLFFIKSFQSCNRKATIRIQNKNLSEQCDSLLQIKDQIIKEKNFIIDSLDNEILTREFLIKDLTTDLKIAGIKVDEAQRRAEAVQRTAERIRTNTTIEIKGAERDTLNKK
ncbi:MAG TPA: hypothetical protein PK122_01055 [Candidatus Paceibacterota bacterium]|nr:hypothetical protein [Candidatus Paceibacterota bacterium]